MHVDTHVASRSAQALALAVGDMLLRPGITVLLCHTKIDGVDQIGGLCPRSADQEVIWFDIAVNKILLMDGLNTGDLLTATTDGERSMSRAETTLRVTCRPTDHLLRGHARGLDAELATAHVKQVLQTGAEQVDNENVVQALLAKVVGLRDAH